MRVMYCNSNAKVSNIIAGGVAVAMTWRSFSCEFLIYCKYISFVLARGYNHRTGTASRSPPSSYSSKCFLCLEAPELARGVVGDARVRLRRGVLVLLPRRVRPGIKQSSLVK